MNEHSKLPPTIKQALIDAKYVLANQVVSLTLQGHKMHDEEWKRHTPVGRRVVTDTIDIESDGTLVWFKQWREGDNARLLAILVAEANDRR